MRGSRRTAIFMSSDASPVSSFRPAARVRNTRVAASLQLRQPFARGSILLLLLLLFRAAAPAPASIAVIWYGTVQPDDPALVYIDFFAANVSFISEFRKYDGCTIAWRQIESGTWSMHGDMQVIHKTAVDGEPVDVEQEYRLESVSRTELRARHLPTGYLFVEKRIARFAFPNCGAGV